MQQCPGKIRAASGAIFASTTAGISDVLKAQSSGHAVRLAGAGRGRLFGLSGFGPFRAISGLETEFREAPPGAIFTKFREAIAKDRRPGARLVKDAFHALRRLCIARLHAGARDVALYFVHWLTDLVGRPARTACSACSACSLEVPRPVLSQPRSAAARSL